MRARWRQILNEMPRMKPSRILQHVGDIDRWRDPVYTTGLHHTLQSMQQELDDLRAKLRERDERIRERDERIEQLRVENAQLRAQVVKAGGEVIASIGEPYCFPRALCIH